MEVIYYELAKRWNRLPYEIKQLPASEFYSMLEIQNTEAMFIKRP